MTEITIAATCRGVRIPHSPYLNETRIRRLGKGLYEAEEIAGALAVIRPGDRVLELGAGLGIVGGVLALNARPSAVLSFEANPELVPHIRALHRLNGLEPVIELRNAVLSSAPDRPGTVPFHVGKSFLGSSLIDRPGRKTTEVRVPTEDFDTVRAAFRPDVLVMDIEGGELELLAHADLTGIRAVVLEFHPGVYGKEGMRACKDALRKVGFRKQEDTSTRTVWTCTRPAWRADGRSTPPRPGGGWSTAIRTVENAQIAAPETSTLSAPSGVADGAGYDVPEAALWRNNRRTNLPFESGAEPGERLAGTWLWGGTMWRYFAHLITESTARLWALDHLAGQPISGIVFIPRRAAMETELSTLQARFLALLGIDLPVRIVASRTQVERLVVPGQGFGLGAISAGTEPYRAFMQSRFGRDIAPEGGERLYVSRSGLGPSRGALLGEARIEAHLAEQGYEIFHPQAHDFETQIARYKAARQIIGSEGSALHFVAHCARPDQQVAIIPRRKSCADGDIVHHLEGFTGRAPLVLAPPLRSWQPGETRSARIAMGEPDLPALQAGLVEAGFLRPGPAWDPLSEVELRAALGPLFDSAEREVAAE